MPNILIIIPAYNEEVNIGSVLARIRAIDPLLDVLVINDGSTDRTSAAVRQCGANLVDLPVNLGIGGAVQAGFLYAHYHDYDIAVQVDGDGQHPPEYLPTLLAPILDGTADMTIGSRFLEYQGFQSTLLRRFGIKYFQRLIFLLTGARITDPTSGFRACNKQVITSFVQYYPRDYPEPESVVIALRKQFRLVEVPVMMNERAGGTSSIHRLATFYYMFKVSLAMIIDKLKPRQAV